MIYSISLVTSLVAILVCGCDSPANQPSTQSKTSSPKATIDAMWADAGIESDSDYRELFPKEAPERAIAPADLRAVITSWNGHKSLRRWTSELTFTCRKQHASLMWSGEIATEYGEDDALKHFDAAMKAHGYEALIESKAIEQLANIWYLSRRHRSMVALSTVQWIFA
jgi:hypothetical protein